MEDSISIKIHSSGGELYRMLMGIGCFVLILWLAVLIHAFSWGMLISFIVALGAYIGVLVAYEKVPQVITADTEKLNYKHFGNKTIMLADIKRLTCEPYSVRTRYDTFQHIRLLIVTADDELELHVSVDANKMLENKLRSKETDIPLIRLYEFLKEKTGLYSDISEI